MQMVRLNITKRHGKAEQKHVERVDLDEKIRRIREENKKRELRFHEIEQDKLQAMHGMPSNRSFQQKKNLSSETNRTTMKGLKSISSKIPTKGRGQKLMEMSHEPLKAENFGMRTQAVGDQVEQGSSHKISLRTKCRTDMRSKILSRKPGDGNSITKHGTVYNHQLSNDVVMDKHKMVEKQKTEHTCMQELPSNNSCNILEETNTSAFPRNEKEKETREENENKCECEDSGKNPPHDVGGFRKERTEEKKTLEKTKPQDINEVTINEQDCRESKQKYNRPKIMVKMKKTESSSSFDESMAKLSPLDLPQNWGDLDFNDDEIPAPTTWM